MEIRLVDGAEDLSHRALDELVLQSVNAQRPPATLGLGEVEPPHRERSVSPRVPPRA